MTFYSAFSYKQFSGRQYQIARNVKPLGGNVRHEYQPTYYELRNKRAIERKFEEAKLDLKSTQIQIEDLELKRLHDLADQTLQIELMQLLAQQQGLMQLIERLQQQKLIALKDDDEFLTLLMCLN